MQLAVGLNHRFRTVAVITDKCNRIVSVGTNSFLKTHTKQFQYARELNQPDRIYLHAEIHAITKNLRKSLHFYSIYIIRIGGKGEIRLAAPCSLCLKAITDVGIKEVFFTNNLGSIEKL